MKKSSITTIVLALAGSIIFNANAQTFQENSNSSMPKSSVSANAGIITKGVSLVSANIDFNVDDGEFPFFSASYEYIVTQFNDFMSLGVGGLFGYYGEKDNYSVINETMNLFGLYGMVDLHFNPISLPKLDLYGGLLAGITKSSYKVSYKGEYSELSDYYDASDDALTTGGVSPFVGARYFINDSIAAGIRLGGWGHFNIGVTYRF